MASSLLRSTARELRRSIPPPRRPAGLLMEGFSPRLLSTDSSNQKMRPPSPNAISSLLFRSDCAKRMDTTKVDDVN
ncbi:hypothetical protein E2562_032935 [Oryza meyeriana var. granulata]|uniref:Uncharacterized protein n=1 Tax=Oryza meyeriana var. granulata TaxID=110450 RepID=A0A6G1DQ42_9ORYZ|nr:hypothetical protein E2562_032935 [Oryza meyeriana var. granulata]